LVYLTGYDPPPLERLTCLVLRPGREPVLVVPSLERPLAESAGASRLADVVDWGETQDPYRLVARIAGPGSRIGCSDRMWAVHLLRLQAALPDTAFISAAAVLGPLRAVKDQHELGLLRRAARAADESFNRILQSRLESRTERDVAGQLAELLLELGHEDVAFTIVGSGPNAASPHHEPSDRTIQEGDAVVLDFGGRVGGYCSDISRTVVVRRAPSEFDRAYEAVREAQDQAFRRAGPGVPAQEVDRAARAVIEDAGFGELFVHRTGHGIGLEEHEPPYIVEGNAEPLRPGMCFSIEPGVYLPGRFGVRIEDIVTVTADGAQRLNHAGRDLEVVG
ncbi:MAG TPA: aminopeptidase P family protein, partial [Actinomycetota bacterium]|nr:aminopeptidase P family protein [Actinomycetota bacterium]